MQGRGVGSPLIRHGIKTLAVRAVPALFLEGSPDYCSRFGFEPPAHEPWMTGTLVPWMSA
jgi:putative acetyltransferase